jgi:phosphomevalonate kinase
MIRVSAPGKLMISGEYVVLDGAQALVAAVDARVFARWSPPTSDQSPDRSARSPAQPSLSPEADRKLGLGSSAAMAAVSAAAVVAHHGLDPATERDRILDWALRGHQAIAPQGSGADVAAAVLGGVVSFNRDTPLDSVSLPWPESLQARVVWTGSPARTSDLVRKVRDFRDRDHAGYQSVVAPLAAAAERMTAAFTGEHKRELIAATRDHAEAMFSLGQACGAEIATDALRRVGELAALHGGAAKPSGAGGGDVAIAFFEREQDAQAFEATCNAEGLDLLSFSLGADGVRRER